MTEQQKPIHIKPSLYAFYFERLKEIALGYGYNLVLHGSMNRDLDLIAIAWQPEVKEHKLMIGQFAEVLGGYVMAEHADEEKDIARRLEKAVNVHGRLWYVININRSGRTNEDGVYEEAAYYLDISVIPPPFGIAAAIKQQEPKMLDRWIGGGRDTSAYLTTRKIPTHWAGDPEKNPYKVEQQEKEESELTDAEKIKNCQDNFRQYMAESTQKLIEANKKIAELEQENKILRDNINTSTV